MYLVEKCAYSGGRVGTPRQLVDTPVSDNLLCYSAAYGGCEDSEEREGAGSVMIEPTRHVKKLLFELWLRTASAHRVTVLSQNREKYDRDS